MFEQAYFYHFLQNKQFFNKKWAYLIGRRAYKKSGLPGKADRIIEEDRRGVRVSGTPCGHRSKGRLCGCLAQAGGVPRYAIADNLSSAGATGP